MKTDSRDKRLAHIIQSKQAHREREGDMNNLWLIVVFLLAFSFKLRSGGRES